MPSSSAARRSRFVAAISRTSTFELFGSAEALEFAFLKDAQEFHLRGGRHVADFVEEKRAFVRQFEFSRLASVAPENAPFS